MGVFLRLYCSMTASKLDWSPLHVLVISPMLLPSSSSHYYSHVSRHNSPKSTNTSFDLIGWWGWCTLKTNFSVTLFSSPQAQFIENTYGLRCNIFGKPHTWHRTLPLSYDVITLSPSPVINRINTQIFFSYKKRGQPHLRYDLSHDTLVSHLTHHTSTIPARNYVVTTAPYPLAW